jgi:NAD(P)-dependent dehydrogenase (short-subunit alcohol dehydrogenase family)
VNSRAGEESLAGQVAVVTGGSRGIGRAIALALADERATVVVASRDLNACQAVVDEIRARSGQHAVAVSCHVGKWQECDALADMVRDELGRCDILVNNAGMSPLYDSLTTVTEQMWDKVTAVNLKGPFRLAARLGELMAAGAGGSIVNVSTIGSLRPGPNELVYACAKAGLNALTVGLATSFGPTVRANTLLPGAVETTIAASWSDDTREKLPSTIPAGRLGTPDDFVGAVLWLTSLASSYVNGASIRVDGGLCRQTT